VFFFFFFKLKLNNVIRYRQSFLDIYDTAGLEDVFFSFSEFDALLGGEFNLLTPGWKSPQIKHLGRHQLLQIVFVVPLYSMNMDSPSLKSIQSFLSSKPDPYKIGTEKVPSWKPPLPQVERRVLLVVTHFLGGKTTRAILRNKFAQLTGIHSDCIFLMNLDPSTSKNFESERETLKLLCKVLSHFSGRF